MNTFSLIVALGPIGLYWMLVGFLHLRRRATIISGSRDLACLAIALMGVSLIGPATLFFPYAAFNFIGVSVWIALLILYSLIWLFVILNSSPRIIVYGLEPNQLVDVLRSVVGELDADAGWLHGHCVAPNLDIDFVVDTAGFGKLSHVIPSRRDQHVASWSKVERRLADRLKNLELDRRPQATFWLSLGVGVVAAIGYKLLKDPQEIAQGMKELFRL